MTGLAPSASSAARQQVLVIGADTTTVRLVEELARAGEQLVVLAYGLIDPDVLAEIQTPGGEVITTSSVPETALRSAGSSGPRRPPSSATTTCWPSGSR